MPPSKQQKERRKLLYTDAKKVAEKQQAGFELSTIAIPKEFSLFGFKRAGHFKVDVIPFIVGKWNPMADIDQVHYERTYYVHRSVGLTEKSYVCPLRNFNEPCPICEEVQFATRRGDPKELIDELKPKRRQLWLFKDLNDADKGIQVFEAGYYKSFGEMLNDALDAMEEDDARRNFFHLEAGMTLKITTKQDSFNGRTFFKVSHIEFLPRNKDYEDSILDEVPCLDDIIKKITYDELKEIFDQRGDGRAKEETVATKQVSKPNRKPQPVEEEEEEEEVNEKPLVDDDDDPDDSDVEEPEKEVVQVDKGDSVKYKGKICEVLKISPDGTSLTLETADGKIIKPVAVEDVELLGDKDKEESGEEESEETDDDDDADLRPRRK